MCSRPRNILPNRVDKQFLINEKDDLFQPELNATTQEEVYGKEIASEDQTNKDSIFGYLPKYEYLRTARHTVSGQMQQQLDWYTARDIKTTVPDILA